MTDYLSSGPDDTEHLEDDDDGDLSWAHPGTLGLAAMVLAVVLLLATGVLTPRSYTAWILPGSGPDDGGVADDYKHFAIASTALSALFFLLPLYLGRKALDQLVPDDGVWTGHLARAATIVAGTGLFLAVVRVLVVLSTDSANSAVFGF